MHSFMDLFKVSSSPDKKGGTPGEEPTKEEEVEEEGGIYNRKKTLNCPLSLNLF